MLSQIELFLLFFKDVSIWALVFRLFELAFELNSGLELAIELGLGL